MRYVLLICIALLATAADQPAEKSLLGGRIRYAPPSDSAWQQAENIHSETAVAYVKRDHGGAIAIEVLPSDAEISGAMGSAIVRTLRQNHKQAGQKVILDPKIERDKRFTLKIHEKYQQGEKVADELHLYRNLGPRVVMATVSAWDRDDAAAADIHKSGEEVLLSAKWVKAAR